MSSLIGRNIFSLGISRIVSGVVLFFVYTRLGVYLGPDGFGAFSLVLAYYTIFFLIVDLGISKYVIKKVSEDKTRAPKYLGNFFAVETLLAGIVLALFYIIPRVLHYESEISSAMLLAGLGLFFASFAVPFASIVQAWQRIHIVAAINFFRTLINALWLALAIVFAKDLAFIFWVFVMGSIFEISAYIFATRKIAKPQFQLDRALMEKMFVYGLPFAFIAGFEVLIGKVDVVIQKFFLSLTEVGLYSAAYRFVDILTFIPGIIAISLFPFLAENFDLKSEPVTSVINRLNRYLTALAIPAGIGAVIIPDKIVLALFDEQFLGSALPFQILIWATVLTFLYAVPNVIMTVKQTRKTAVILAGVTILNIVLNIVLVPRYGIVASAWTTVFSYLLVMAAYLYHTRAITRFKLFSYLPIPLLASVIMGSAIYSLKHLNVFVLIAIAIAIYFPLLIVLRFLKRDDLRFLKSIFKAET